MDKLKSTLDVMHDEVIFWITSLPFVVTKENAETQKQEVIHLMKRDFHAEEKIMENAEFPYLYYHAINHKCILNCLDSLFKDLDHLKENTNSLLAAFKFHIEHFDEIFLNWRRIYKEN